jgi:hypothetical protein
VAVTVVGDITTVVTGATNGHVTKEMLQQGWDSMKPKPNQTKLHQN